MPGSWGHGSDSFPTLEGWAPKLGATLSVSTRFMLIHGTSRPGSDRSNLSLPAAQHCYINATHLRSGVKDSAAANHSAERSRVRIDGMSVGVYECIEACFSLERSPQRIQFGLLLR